MPTLAFLSGAPRTSTKDIATLGGGRQHILGTISGFKANGWQVATCIVGDEVSERWLTANHEMDRGRPLLVRIAADILRIALFIKYVRRALRDISDADWVYERYAAYQCFGLFFQRRGVPWILETNTPLFDQAESDLRHVGMPHLMRWAETFAYRKCDILVVISEELKRMLSDRLNIPSAKIVVLPNAADVELFNPDIVVPRRLFGDDTFVIGFQGGMYKWAGLEYMVRMIAILRSRGLDVAGVLVGDGHEKLSLQGLAAELRISDYVRFPGRVSREEVPGYIAGFDLCYSGQVNFSSAGSMYHSPLKLYDYMAMARPVVASRFADAITLTRDGSIGYLFTPCDLEDLLRAVTLAYKERSNLAAMGVEARAEVLTNHTWPARVRGFIAVAEKMLADNRPLWRSEGLPSPSPLVDPGDA